MWIFSSPEQMLRMSYCDHPLSVVSSPGALLHASLCHGLFVVRLLLAKFHIFDISRTDWLGWNLVGGIVATWRFRFAKMAPFRYPRWPPCRPSWNSSNDISYQTVSLIEPKLDGRHHSDIDSEFLKAFRSDIQDGRLEILQMTSPKS